MTGEWYCAYNGEEYGPLSLPVLREKLQGFDLTKIYVWREGFEDWKRADEVDEFEGMPPTPSSLGTPESEAVTKEKPKRALKYLERLVGIAASLAAVAAVKLFGAVVWVPMLFISIAWIVLTKFEMLEAVRPMMAIIIGHSCWTIVGFAMTYFLRHSTEFAGLASVDVIVVVVLSIWVIATNSFWSAFGVLAYQLLGLSYLVTAGDETHAGEAALVMHILLRILGAIAAAYAGWRLWSSKPHGAPARGS
jgi:GYF domain 2